MSSAHRRASRRRRRLVLLPLALVLAAAGLKLTTMWWFSTAGVAAHDEGRHEASLTAFERLGIADVVERWRAPLGRGVARFRQGDLAGAERAFAAALATAPERCDVRFNLVVTIEAQGDALPDRNRSAQRYVAALEQLDAEACPARGAGGPGDRLAEAEERILAKLADRPERVEDLRDPEAGESFELAPGEGEEINELEERNRAAAAGREAGRDEDTSGIPPADRSNW